MRGDISLVCPIVCAGYVLISHNVVCSSECRVRRDTSLVCSRDSSVCRVCGDISLVSSIVFKVCGDISLVLYSVQGVWEYLTDLF